MATKNKKSTKKLSFRKTSPLKMLLAVVVVSAVAGIGTYLLFRSHAATVGPRMFMAASNNTQEATFTQFNYGVFGDRYVAGDWDANKSDTLGVYRPSNSTFFLTNNNSDAGVAGFGFGNSGDIPLAGDWNGDGTTTVGVYRPAEATFYLASENKQGGGAVETFALGKTGDVPITCDWNGDRITDLGLYRPSEGKFYMALRYGTWGVFNSFSYGNAGITDIPVCGNWDSSAANDANFNYDTVGVYRGANFYLKNTNDAGNGIEQRFGQLGWLPLVGRWTGTPQTLIGAYSLGGATIPNPVVAGGGGSTATSACGPDIAADSLAGRKLLQTCINSLIPAGTAKLDVDGIAGPLTKAACTKYLLGYCPAQYRILPGPTGENFMPGAGGSGSGATIQGGIETSIVAVNKDQPKLYCEQLYVAISSVVNNAQAIRSVYDIVLPGTNNTNAWGSGLVDQITSQRYWDLQIQKLKDIKKNKPCSDTNIELNKTNLATAVKHRTNLRDANAAIQILIYPPNQVRRI